jgi:hypothetical protein
MRGSGFALLTLSLTIYLGCGEDPEPAPAGAGAENGEGASAGSDAISPGGGSTHTGGASSDAGAGGDDELGGGATAGSGPAEDPGIAAMYPGDEGIADDPAVIFADDFESYGQASELNDRWDAVYQNQFVSLATDADNVFAGDQALEFTLPEQDAELSDAVDKVLSEELDVLYLRYYSRFQSPYDVVGSSHNGSSISAHYFVDGQATPGVPADGTNKFLVNLENWRGEEETASPGFLNVYVYHPEQRSQRGDHWFPTGLVSPNTSLPYDFGGKFQKHADIIPELDRWYCYEYMVKANTVGKRDGEVAIWLDGELIVRFGNLSFRSVPELKIDRFGLSFHIHSNPNGESKKWYDNVVAATSYIGPMAE